MNISKYNPLEDRKVRIVKNGKFGKLNLFVDFMYFKYRNVTFVLLYEWIRSKWRDSLQLNATVCSLFL